MKRAVIVGGGIAGMTTALHLKDRAREVPGGLEVLVLEAGTEPGGNIRTERAEGFTIEQGPNGYLDNVPTTPALVRRLGLTDEVQRADEASAKRFLFRNGCLHPVPTGPGSFLRSPLLSLGGRLRVLAEPLARSKLQGKDETIFEFASRRIGREAAEILVGSMVSGVFAGDIHELSLSSAFPKMSAMEDAHGSLVKAMIARALERRAVARARRGGEGREGVGEGGAGGGGPAGPGGTLTSFRTGLDALPLALARELGEALRCEARVARVRRAEGGGRGVGDGEAGAQGEEGYPRPWILELAGGRTVSSDVVVLAVPASRAAPMLSELDATVAGELGAFSTAGLAVVALGFESESLGGPPDGFGFLVPRGAGVRILGCLWDSTIFPGRAPSGKVLLRAMVGGAHDPGAVKEDPASLIEIVRRDLDTTMGLQGEPILSRVYRWPLGIGQYTVGHGDRIRSLEDHLAGHRGLWVAGSSFYGISMNACIEKAGEQVREILDLLADAAE